VTTVTNAESPKSQLEDTFHSMHQLVESDSYGEQEPAERQASARRLLDGIFDWREMAKRALDQHWSARSPTEQQEFVGLFATLLGGAYASKLENAGAARVDVVSETVDGERAVIRTQLIVEREEDVSVDYHVGLQGGRWKVYEVIFDDIGMVANYRAQFKRVLERHSYSELLTRVKEQLKVKR
jgi:phospholipid transport system substrate-binding protein